MCAQGTDELVQYVEEVLLLSSLGYKYAPNIAVQRTCSLCIRSPIKFMKSISSVGSKCASRFVISDGMSCATLDPVVARIDGSSRRSLLQITVLSLRASYFRTVFVVLDSAHVMRYASVSCQLMGLLDRMKKGPIINS